MSEFSRVTQVEDKHISRICHVPIPKGPYPGVPNFRDPYLGPNGLYYSDDITQAG